MSYCRECDSLLMTIIKFEQISNRCLKQWLSEQFWVGYHNTFPERCCHTSVMCFIMDWLDLGS